MRRRDTGCDGIGSPQDVGKAAGQRKGALQEFREGVALPCGRSEETIVGVLDEGRCVEERRIDLVVGMLHAGHGWSLAAGARSIVDYSPPAGRYDQAPVQPRCD